MSTPTLIATPLVIMLWATASQGEADAAWQALCADCQNQAFEAARRKRLTQPTKDPELDECTPLGLRLSRRIEREVKRWGHPRPLRVCGLTEESS